MADYLIYYREELPTTRAELRAWGRWDILLSAYSLSDRVQQVFEGLSADEKWWIIHDEYAYAPEQLPRGQRVGRSARDEQDFIAEVVQETGLERAPAKLCIDITGFMRPQLLRLLYELPRLGYTTVDLVYSEPIMYDDNERTVFSKGPIANVRQIIGYEGTHDPDTSADVLIIGTGYDHELIKKVAYEKESTRKRLVYGLPSLRPHMYQENVYRVSRAKDVLGEHFGDSNSTFFAPANDPFATAAVLSEIARSQARMTNLYLAPLGTKVQCAAFALYYLTECVGHAASIIFPFRSGYSQETAVGLSRAWLFRFELPARHP